MRILPRTWLEPRGMGAIPEKKSDAQIDSEGPGGSTQIQPRRLAARGIIQRHDCTGKVRLAHGRNSKRAHLVIPGAIRSKAITGPGEPFLDAYVPSLLDEGVYFADGQIQEEDYEYGSFVQSKMYHEGVTCSDCHNPHSLALPSKDLNSVCGSCHSLAKFGAARASPSQDEFRRSSLCQLSHAGPNIHGDGCSARPQFPRTATGSFDCLWDSQRLQPMSHRQVRKVGGRCSIDMVWRRPPARTSFCRSSRCGPPRAAGSGEIADIADHGLFQARYCARYCTFADPAIPQLRLPSCCSGQPGGQ